MVEILLRHSGPILSGVGGDCCAGSMEASRPYGV